MSSKNNGRVDVLEGDNFRSYHLFQENSKRDSFSAEAVKGIHVRTKLADLFFSQHNIDMLQEAIRYQIYVKSCKKHIIDRQSDAELKLIMRAYYLQQGQHRQYDVENQVRELNTLVLNFCVPRILQEINMYMTYKKDIDSLPQPLARGEFSSSKGSKQLIAKDF
jgi:hypothetical protein